MLARQPSQSLPKSLPPSIQSPRGKLVYLYLATAGRATADEIAQSLDLSGLCCYAVLRKLVERDLVVRSDGAYQPAPRPSEHSGG